MRLSSVLSSGLLEDLSMLNAFLLDRCMNHFTLGWSGLLSDSLAPTVTTFALFRYQHRRVTLCL